MYFAEASTFKFVTVLDSIGNSICIDFIWCCDTYGHCEIIMKLKILHRYHSFLYGKYT